MTLSVRQRALLPSLCLILGAGSAAWAQNTSGPQTPSPEGLNPTQEIAKETPEGPALVAGPTEIRIGGYVGVTGIYRTTNSGGGIGTNFGAISYPRRGPGGGSGAPLSAPGSRPSGRVDPAPCPPPP